MARPKAWHLKFPINLVFRPVWPKYQTRGKYDLATFLSVHSFIGAYLKHLIFSPFSGVLPHSRFETNLAKGLQKLGHQILVVQCDGLFSNYCITMSAHGLKEDSDDANKRRVCENCKRTRNAVRSGFEKSASIIDRELTLEDRRNIDALIQSVTPENWTEFQYDGLSVGKIASYEFLIHYKKNSTDLNASEFKAYRIALRNCLSAQIAVSRILQRFKPDRVLVFDTSYSVNNMVKTLAENAGITVYDFRSGMNLSNQYGKMLLFKDDIVSGLLHLKTKIWNSVKGNPISSSEIKHVADHFRSLFRGTNVFAYSAPRSGEASDLRTKFGVLPHQKLIVAALSSYDERFAAHLIGRVPDGRDALFPSQEAWCEALFDWVKGHPNYFLIVRVHPREFPNKREGVKSVHVDRLRACFEKKPNNVAINWPDDNISIYNLAEETDLFLSAWSNVGLEMSLFGLPVVIYADDLVFYPAEDLNFVGKTKLDYFACIEKALIQGWSFERVRMTFRWLSTLYTLSTVDLKEKDSKARNFLVRALNSLGHRTKIKGLLGLVDRLYITKAEFDKDTLVQIEDVLVQKRDSLADSRFLPAPSPVSREQEADYIREQLESLFHGTPSKIVTHLRAHFNSK